MVDKPLILTTKEYTFLQKISKNSYFNITLR